MRNRSAGVFPDKRTLVVLGALVVSMTLTGGVLLALEPGPVASLSGISLQSLDQPSEPTPAKILFHTASPRDWKAIIIHDSGSPAGSAESLDAAARRRGIGGLGYDFVVNNGSQKADGLIEVGYRWRQQRTGAFVSGHSSEAQWCNQKAVGICLIGDAQHGTFTKAQLRQLVWLVQRLQRRFNIPADRVLLDLGRRNKSALTAFPQVWFRQQLLDTGN